MRRPRQWTHLIVFATFVALAAKRQKATKGDRFCAFPLSRRDIWKLASYKVAGSNAQYSPSPARDDGGHPIFKEQPSGSFNKRAVASRGQGPALSRTPNPRIQHAQCKA